MQEQVEVMLAMQDDMNTRVNNDWRRQDFAWYRAIWIECAELLDHYGWKWWKKQTPDIEQVRLELIDIWHFGLSLLLQSDQSPAALARHIDETLVVATDEPDFRLDLEAFAARTLAERRFDVAGFGRLMAGIDLSFDMLYTGYVGKNVLNFFRQDHGYQEGTYKKQWGDREDNEHLVDIVQGLDGAAATFKDDLYAALKARYQGVC
ncbi:dUTP diphosphatase [Exilibacterium tricleocarpae]|uniref:dUTP diphosphatase n=1 Tax=Exilibacterium tricleocarpae TaxID=2591008 RepID=A0A545T8F5_9GAMM|nr:dUTP diphosphatase [Exilibacterium tricleocarpae]TQV73497.1 dUTP diphosphatase [Exilibacterium tricleocarpae]